VATRDAVETFGAVAAEGGALACTGGGAEDESIRRLQKIVVNKI
jgi:hypothetical protein